MSHPSIVILDGSRPFSELKDATVKRASLVVYQHPKHRHLFGVYKIRQLPRDMKLGRILGRNLTRKTLDRLITANLP